MPKLILKRKAEVIKELPLKNTRAIVTIGSDEDNDLVIDDKQVSNRHAQLERHGNQYYIRDLRSAFGTFLNGEKITEQAELHNGDQLTIGGHTIVFENPLEATTMQADSVDDSITDTPAEPTTSGRVTAEQPFAQTESFGNVDTLESELEALEMSLAHQRQQQARSKTEMAPYYLLAIYGPYRGKRFQLKYGETRIGRDSKLNDIVIRHNKRGEIDPSISRRHATISYHDQAFHVLDRRSKTRTYVNQEEVPEDREIRLNPGDEIEIVSDQQSTIFRFVAEGNWDFSSPKRAGVWWLRYRQKMLFGAAAVAVVLGLVMAIGGFSDYRLLKQQPEPFSMKLLKWRAASGKYNREPVVADRDAALYRPLAAVADFTGDGYVDMAAVAEDLTLRLIDGEQKRLAWKLSEFVTHPDYALLLSELNDNGLTDIVFVSKNGRLIGVDGVTGAEIFASPYFKLPFSGPPVSADFDGDGWNDVAVAEASGAIRIGFNRLLEYQWQQIEPGFMITAPLSAVDFNGDRAAELIVVTDRGLILILDGRTLKAAGTIDINEELGKAFGSMLTDSRIRFPVGAADLNGDDVPDLVCSTAQGHLLAIDGANRQQLWSLTLLDEVILNLDFPFPFAFGDINNDGTPDVIASSVDGRILAISGQRRSNQTQTLWTHAPKTPGSAIEFVLAVDVNKDRAADAIVLDRNHRLKLLDGRSGRPLWDTGQPLSDITSGPLLADFGDDTQLDILLLARRNRVFQYQTNSRVPASTVAWGQVFSNAQHTQLAGFRLPGPNSAMARLIFGLILIASAAVAVFFHVHQYRKWQI
ncbi:MAG: FHA domain-containing protein [candidate division KSB1 bacterium]|nr:FHA domain-containing protein [candidate division KSB1 bacterium]